MDPKVMQIIEAQAVRPLVDVLKALQREEGCLTEASLKALASDRLLSLDRLYGIASSYAGFIFEKQHQEKRPLSAPVPLPGFLEGFRETATANIVKSGVLTAAWEAAPATLAAYEKTGGMQVFARAASLTPEQSLKEIVEGGLTRKPRAWTQVAQAGEAPVIVANCHSGDPVAGQASMLLAADPFSVIEGMYIGAMATGASRGWLYLDPEDESQAERLTGAAEEVQRAANINFAVEVFVGPESLVGSDDSVAAAAITGDRPVPAANPDNLIACGIWSRPTICDSAEFFAATARTSAVEEKAAGRLYQVGGNVETAGIVEAAPETAIGELLAAAGAEGGWTALVGGLSGTLVKEGGEDLSLAVLEREDNPRWRTVFVIDDSLEPRAAAAAVAEYNGRYLCGGCIPCRIGSVRMAELAGRETPDIRTLEQLAFTLERTGLCQVGRGAAGLMLSSLELQEK